MRDATRLFLLIGAAALLPACEGNEAEQNVVITNDIPAGADVEALPPDESSATSTEELQNGADEPDTGVSEGNSY